MPISIPKAIEILQTHKFDDIPNEEQDIMEAIDLSIEALKRENARRSLEFSKLWGALPGETTDEIKIVSDQPGESHIYQEGG